MKLLEGLSLDQWSIHDSSFQAELQSLWEHSAPSPAAASVGFGQTQDMRHFASRALKDIMGNSVSSSGRVNITSAVQSAEREGLP